MNGLYLHHTAGDTHANLAFHPDCPTCRTQRLQGKLAGTGILSRRAQTLAAAVALAVTPGVAAVPAWADTPDSQEVGTQDPGLMPSPDPADDPTFKPPQGPVGTDVDSGPVVNTDAPTDDAEPDPLEVDTTAPPQPPVAPAPAPVAAPPAPAPPDPPPMPVVPVTAPTAPQAVAPPTTAPQAQPRPRPQSKPERSKHKSNPNLSRPLRVRPMAPSPRSVPQASASARLAPTPQGPGSAPNPQPAATEPPTAPGRPYTVRSGDSLWSIARDLAGPSASNGQIAALVDGLWGRNADRIGTGSPDLLKVGTELTLP